MAAVQIQQPMGLSLLLHSHEGIIFGLQSQEAELQANLDSTTADLA